MMQRVVHRHVNIGLELGGMMNRIEHSALGPLSFSEQCHIAKPLQLNRLKRLVHIESEYRTSSRRVAHQDYWSRKVGTYLLGRGRAR